MKKRCGYRWIHSDELVEQLNRRCRFTRTGEDSHVLGVEQYLEFRIRLICYTSCVFCLSGGLELVEYLDVGLFEG